ncbi:MAG: uroporphyrinogen decarboxylase [Chloroherpetonaceae bacterium]|nr:uroporphyrinogen decarboxylase [Chloroherpetonaceae bacterium]MCS7211650.1 uroporphyrinogen decarboxylase [Chloroherpetonaceae bacterium]MDW8020080.1 uroporphyrinogen decarboxylase [Chloroherpetonaceae bacterium]MDW8464926.1 uroporphyrinogen decarboxylase [Chloroherpetonaceae bacterium]
MIKNDLVIRSLQRKPVPRTPIWIMRQAGRYLPEYREVRKKTDFLTLCKTPELAAEVTIQPVEILQVDAAIIFSDILVVPEAMGLPLEMQESQGPQFATPVRTRYEIEKLVVPDVSCALRFVEDAIRLTKRELQGRVPIIGFSGSAWTLFVYVVEGRGNKDFKAAKQMIYASPDDAHALLCKLNKVLTDYLLLQIEAGADIVQIFDTWASLLSEEAFKTFSLPYLHEAVQTVKMKHPNVPVIVFAKGANTLLSEIVSTGCDAIGLDWTIDIGKARWQLSDRVALQGNLDPTVLYAPPDIIRQEAAKILQKFGDHSDTSGHVFNLGHGILPDIDPAHLRALIDFVKSESVQYHRNAQFISNAN